MAAKKGKKPAKLASRGKTAAKQVDTRDPRIEYISAYVANPDTKVGEEMVCRLNHGVCEASSHKGYVGKTREELEKVLVVARGWLVVGAGGWKPVGGTWYIRPHLPGLERHIQFDLLKEDKLDDDLKTGLLNGVFDSCFG